MKQFFANPESEPLSHYRFCPLCGTPLSEAAAGPQTRMQCFACGYTQYRNPYPGVVVLIADEEQGRPGKVPLGQRVLLGKRSPGSYAPGAWCLPGGFMEFDEHFLTAAHREVLEETGLSIEIDSIINVVSNFHTPRIHTLVIVLLALSYQGEPRPGDDLDELAWFPLAGPLPPMAFPADEHIIQVYASGNAVCLPVDPRYRIQT